MNLREDKMKELIPEDARVQYDGKDEDRIFDLAEGMSKAMVGVLEALKQYQDALKAPVDENFGDLMKSARYNVVLAQANLQGLASSVAVCLRIDADKAFEEFTKEEPDYSGL